VLSVLSDDDTPAAAPFAAVTLDGDFSVDRDNYLNRVMEWGGTIPSPFPIARNPPSQRYHCADTVNLSGAGETFPCGSSLGITIDLLAGPLDLRLSHSIFAPYHDS
jgi:hypothetical protein